MHPIELKNINTHNLKNIDIKIQPNSLNVVCGVSGSGKSSLVFDTVHAESYRRYIDSLSSFTKQHLKTFLRPDLGTVSHLVPSIAVKQSKHGGYSKLSNVGTITEISLLLQTLYSYQGQAHCPDHGPIKLLGDSIAVCDAILDILEQIKANCTKNDLQPSKVFFAVSLKDIVGRTEKITHKYFNNLMYMIKQQGFKLIHIPDNSNYEQISVLTPYNFLTHVAIDVDEGPGYFYLINQTHLLIDRMSMAKKIDKSRVLSAIENVDKMSSGIFKLFFVEKSPKADSCQKDPLIKDSYLTYLIKYYQIGGRVCSQCNYNLIPPTVELFNRNNPVGWCSVCSGSGQVMGWDWSKILLFDDSIIDLLKNQRILREYLPVKERSKFLSNLKKHKINPRSKIADLDHNQLIYLKYGDHADNPYRDDRKHFYDHIDNKTFAGLAGLLTLYFNIHPDYLEYYYNWFSKQITCRLCKGSGIGQDARSYLIDGISIDNLVTDYSLLSLSKLLAKTILFNQEGTIPPKLDNHFQQFYNNSYYNYHCPYSFYQKNNILDHPDLMINKASSLLETYEQIFSRLNYLINIGVGYLTLGRSSSTLSGGELQRINMARCLGSNLTETLYCLDEPTAGLHPIDTQRLVKSMIDLKNQGNTLLVVEHDPYIISKSDYLIHIGPYAGDHGGKICYQGKNKQITGVTTAKKDQPLKKTNRLVFNHPVYDQRQTFFHLSQANSLNLKNIDIFIPFGKISAICGVSGSGKSTLINHILIHAYAQYCDVEIEPSDFTDYQGYRVVYCGLDKLKNLDYKLNNSQLTDKKTNEKTKKNNLNYNDLNLTEIKPRDSNNSNNNKLFSSPLIINKKNHKQGFKVHQHDEMDATVTDVVFMSQETTKGSTRSNFITYMDIADSIRSIFAKISRKANNYHFSASSFSPFSYYGSCNTCEGTGTITQDISYLGSVEVPCPTCKGKQFNPNILSVKYKNKDIHEVMSMTVSTAYEFFKDKPVIAKVLKQAMDLGLDYLIIGQATSSYSGGEIQRVKIIKLINQIDQKIKAVKRYRQDAKELQKLLIIFDEPSTGLSEYDIKFLWKKFNLLKAQGHTVIIVEHHLGLIQAADWIIELGPYAADQGGKILYQGSSNMIGKTPNSKSLIVDFIDN